VVFILIYRSRLSNIHQVFNKLFAIVNRFVSDLFFALSFSSCNDPDFFGDSSLSLWIRFGFFTGKPFPFGIKRMNSLHLANEVPLMWGLKVR